MGRRLQDCNGADALVGGQFPDKFSTGWHCLEARASPREFTDEMTGHIGRRDILPIHGVW
jgi:hypothetical protein